MKLQELYESSTPAAASITKALKMPGVKVYEPRLKSDPDFAECWIVNVLYKAKRGAPAPEIIKVCKRQDDDWEYSTETESKAASTLEDLLVDLKAYIATAVKFNSGAKDDELNEMKVIFKDFLPLETLDVRVFATWKQEMKAKGAVKFESVEMDHVLAYDKNGKCIGSFDKQRNVAEAQDFDDDDIDVFYIAGWNSEAERAWVGAVMKQDGKWVEKDASGTPPDDWGGKRYMSYLSPDEVMSWLKKDYDEVEGPFTDKDSAIDRAEYHFGPLSEAWVDSGAKDANGKWADYRDGKIGVEAMATWLYKSRVHKKTRAEKLKSAYGAIAQQENTSKLINKSKGDALRAALKREYGSED